MHKKKHTRSPYTCVSRYTRLVSKRPRNIKSNAPLLQNLVFLFFQQKLLHILKSLSISISTARNISKKKNCLTYSFFFFSFYFLMMMNIYKTIIIVIWQSRQKPLIKNVYTYIYRDEERARVPIYPLKHIHSCARVGVSSRRDAEA